MSFILLLLSVNILFITSCKESTLNENEIDFSINDTSIITKIQIYNADNLLKIEKTNDNWKLNDLYSVEISKLTRLFNSISLIDLKSPLPENAIEPVKSKIINQTYIEIYSNENLLKAYYLGDYVQNSGNYMMMKNAENPYIVYIPSFDFDLRFNFNTDYKEWMNKEIFSYNANEIKSIAYTNNILSESFYLEKNEDGFHVYKNNLSTELENLNVENIEYYLTHYNKVPFMDFFVNYDNTTLDSLKNENYEFCFEIENTSGKMVKLEAYSLNILGKKDKNKFLGILNDKELLLAKYYDFDLLMKNYTYFLK